MLTPPFKPGAAVSNNDIMAAFHCACEGGIRPANATDSIVLVLNHTKMSHQEDWRGNVLFFRGGGAKGDQSLDKGRNKTLLEAFGRNRPVYLFEVFKPKEYIFRGRMELAGEPFQKEEAGSDGLPRKVWIFPLKISGGK